MTFETATLLSNVVIAAGGLAWVWVAVSTYKGQMNAQIFIDCNERYDSILSSFPLEALEGKLHLSTEMPPDSPELTLCALRYLNLASEEYYLYKRAYVTRAVWTMWEGELLRTLRSPLFRREWMRLKEEFESFPEFTRYVNQAQQV